jgi:ABC-type dipeptide/oligopeptide/nickel transport system permease component
MGQQIVHRLLISFPALLGVLFLCFCLLQVVPADPAMIIAGPDAKAETIAAIRQELGLDRSIPIQFFEYILRVLRGDLGRSIQYDVPVASLIASRLAVTLPLTAMAAGFMVVAAIPLGVYAATRPQRWGDYLTMALSQVGVAIPGFWAGLLLVLLFSVKLGWFRSGGFDGWSAGVVPGLRSLLLPAVALGLFQFAVLARTTRSAMLEVLGEEYVKTARAKGVAERAVLFRHALRNAMIPIVTVAGIQLGQLMAGSIILESVFYLPGLGRLALGAISARDLPVVQGVVLFVASVIVAINVAVDLLYPLLSPQTRR